MIARAVCLVLSLMWAGIAWASPQSDALDLQQVAAARLRELTEEFRRKFDAKPLQAALELIGNELVQSNKVLREAGDDVDLAAGLIKQGDVWRLLDQQARAASLYGEAAVVAQRGKHLGYEADAWSSKARSEYASGRIEQAASDAEHAVKLALASSRNDALAKAYNTLTEVHTKRKNLVAGEAASKLEFAAAYQASDRVAIVSAYVSRANLRNIGLQECDFGGDVVPCLESLDATRADYAAARAIATELAYPGMAKAMANLLLRNEELRVMIENRGRR
jgi:tetratricopeptide (TPR) repeat protein